jgi:hypothetical protein
LGIPGKQLWIREAIDAGATVVIGFVQGSQPSVQNLPYPRLPSKDMKIRIYKTIVLMWFCMGVKHGL